MYEQLQKASVLQISVQETSRRQEEEKVELEGKDKGEEMEVKSSYM